MRDVSTPAPGAGRSGQFAEVLRHIEQVLTEGLRHGFFECSIAGETTNGGKRQVVVRAGKSHKFNLSKDEIPR
jgi:predicted hotdog family 3-hydroxylacyl-ACP dehydratase